MGEHGPNPPQAGEENHGDAGQTGQAHQAQCPQGPEHGNGHDQHVEKMRAEEVPPAGGQVQLDDVLHGEQRPDEIIDGVERLGHAAVQGYHQGHDEDREPGQGEHGHGPVHRSAETLVGPIPVRHRLHVLIGRLCTTTRPW